MRSYLQLTRAHTVPLEAVPATVGALLATGGSITLGVVYWAIFGVLYHLAGYGHNSLRDWEKGYDISDPNKQHHPLNTGEIRPGRAKTFIQIILSITVFYALIGVLYSQSLIATAVLITGIILGVAYNEYGKETPLKFIFISVAHSTVFAVPYLALGGTINTPFLFIWSVVLFWVVFQIAISGEVKDLEQDEENILKTLKAVEYMRTSINPAVIASLSIRLIITFTAISGSLLLGGGIIEVYIILLIGIISIYESQLLVTVNLLRRSDALSQMSRIEIYSMSKLLVATSPVLEMEISVLLFILSGVWVVIFNKYQWGTTLAPDV